jgi:hypothetical protein
MGWRQLLERRAFLKTSGVGLAGAAVLGPRAAWPHERAMARAERMTDSFVKLKAEQSSRKHELPEPADFHRLPLSWYKEKVRAIKGEARERGVTGGLLFTDRWNLIYTTGLFHSTTQRPFAAFFPMDDEQDSISMYP